MLPCVVKQSVPSFAWVTTKFRQIFPAKFISFEKEMSAHYMGNGLEFHGQMVSPKWVGKKKPKVAAKFGHI